MTLKFTRILCSVDFNENSAAALRYACRLLDPEGTLFLVHIVPQAQPAAFESYQPVTELARESLANFAREHIPDQTRRELLVRAGDPPGVIVCTADELAVDLIVMATHRHRGLVHLVLGSFAERVLREARQPVLTLRPAGSMQPPSA